MGLLRFKQIEWKFTLMETVYLTYRYVLWK